jgi:hypothetical protein
LRLGSGDLHQRRDLRLLFCELSFTSSRLFGGLAFSGAQLCGQFIYTGEGNSLLRLLLLWGWGIAFRILRCGFRPLSGRGFVLVQDCAPTPFDSGRRHRFGLT